MACHKDSLDIKAENKQITIETDISKQKAPDGGWGWFVVLGSLLLRIIVGKQCLNVLYKCCFIQLTTQTQLNLQLYRF